MFIQKYICPKKYLGQKKLCPKKIKAPKKLGAKILVKIGAVIAEILLTLKNVTRTHVAETNVTLKVTIC